MVYTLLLLFLTCAFAQIRHRPTTSSSTSETQEFSTGQVTILRNYIDGRFGLSAGADLPGCRRVGSSSGQCGPLLVRMSFHAAVGGFRGCINLKTQSDNKGLRGIAEFLDEAWKSDIEVEPGLWISVNSVMTRADFWALACTEAMIQASGHQPANSPQVTLQISFGREDCGPDFEMDEVHDFPDGVHSCRHVLSILQRMGMNTEEAVALIAAGHSMGETHPQNSGYSGEWAPDHAVLSNSLARFVRRPENVGYTHRPGNAHRDDDGNNARKCAFIGDEFPAILLNTDICLFHNIEGRDQRRGSELHKGVLSCTGQNGCTAQRTARGRSPTAGIIERFANSQNAFFDVLTDAWTKMLNSGYRSSDLSDPCTCIRNETFCGDDRVPPPPPAPEPQIPADDYWTPGSGRGDYKPRPPGGGWGGGSPPTHSWSGRPVKPHPPPPQLWSGRPIRPIPPQLPPRLWSGRPIRPFPPPPQIRPSPRYPVRPSPPRYPVRPSPPRYTPRPPSYYERERSKSGGKKYKRRNNDLMTDFVVENVVEEKTGAVEARSLEAFSIPVWAIALLGITGMLIVVLGVFFAL